MSTNTKFSLNLVLKEADNLLTSVLSSIKSNTNKSYVLLAVCSSAITYSYVNIMSGQYESIVLLIGSISSVVFMFSNLIPNEVNLKGCLPEELMDNEYFEDVQGEDLDIDYLNIIIDKYNSDIKDNKILVQDMVERFNKSLLCISVSFVIYGILTFLLFIKCF